MLPLQRKSVVSISVDLPNSRFENADAEVAFELGARLVELFQQNAFPATWAIPDPAASPWARQLAQSSIRHEIALLADSSWAGPSVGRTEFSRELLRRAESVAALGRRLSTLALHELDLQDNLDLLVKHRIPLVRGDAATEARATSQFLKPQSVRFGVWRAPITIALVGRSGWLRTGEVSAARRVIQRSMKEGGFVHLVIDTFRLAGKKLADVGQIRGLLQFIRQQELRGALEVGPLQEVASRWIKPRTVVPSRSILRRAG